MSFSSRRVWLLSGVAALFASGALGVACSSNGGFNDGGTDSSTDSTSNPDTKSNTDSGNGDGGSNPDVVTGPCTTTILTGACDIVQQNCPNGQECDAVQGADGGFAATCVANATGNIKEGFTCTQSGNSNPCVAGLECIQGRCSKPCCFGVDSECGTSHPEGFQGHCNLNITLDSTQTAFYSVCAYSATCEPFGIEACATDQTCVVSDQNGTAACSDYAGTDGGQKEGTTCSASNACLDGMGCYGSPDGGAYSCQWNCYVPPGPFDAGVADGGAGKGGCPTAEKCTPINWGGALPTWLGLCEK